MEPKFPVFSTCIRPDGMKLLAIGHSNCRLSAMELRPIFDNLHYPNFTLGVIYRGDSDFAVHAHFATTNEAGVVYHKPTLEKFCDPSELENLVDYASILQDEQWDTVVVYQGGGSFGETEQYDKSLTEILDTVHKYCPNAKVFYGLHWPYPVTSTTACFQKYNCDQKAMFDAAITATKKYILPNQRICGIIPAATLMQSLRTKYGEAFHVSDLVHINPTGCVVVGMLWYAFLTGLPVDEMSYLPEGVSPEVVADAKKVIAQLLQDPFTVVDLKE